MKDFTTGRISKPLIIFAAPMMIGNLFQQMYNIVDAMIVGRYVGAGALAAVGISVSVSIFLISALIGLSSGAAVVVAQFFGAKQNDRVESAVSVSIIFNMCLSALLLTFGIVFAPHLLRMLNTDPEVMDDAVIYMRIMMAGMPFNVLYNMYTSFLRALGDSKRPLYILIFTVTLSGVLTLYLVIVQGMGVAGAAGSTVFSQLVAAVLCYLYARRSVPLLKVNKFTFDFGMFRLILKYGVPAAVQFSIVSLAHLFISRLINSFGAATMAAITAVARIDQFAIMPVHTLSMAMSTFVAQNMGAEREDRAMKGFRVTLLYMLGFSVFISAVLMALAPQLISLFLNPDDLSAPEILYIGQRYLNIMVIFYFVFAFLFAFNGFFRGVGDAVIAMVFPIFSLTLRTSSAYILVLVVGMGADALAWSIPIGWTLASLGSWIYFKKRLWVGKVAT